jgi:hypothetical protein
VSGLAVVLVFVFYLVQNRIEEDLLPKAAELKLLAFPTTCLHFQGIRQQNLNIVTDWISHPTLEFIFLQSVPNLKDFVRRLNNTILHTISL